MMPRTDISMIIFIIKYTLSEKASYTKSMLGIYKVRKLFQLRFMHSEIAQKCSLAYKKGVEIANSTCKEHPSQTKRTLNA